MKVPIIFLCFIVELFAVGWTLNSYFYENDSGLPFWVVFLFCHGVAWIGSVLFVGTAIAVAEIGFRYWEWMKER